ncbi:MAG: RluA family pseudouridine synthase [Paludisphaera borealis]|uniref:RluA family pseudouridine synthase n=1 Tax=Paludisphaera borealis TaxID=1387353 RepID=UPI0028468130|nr:RluA family pseudouridine synthase [Paludisphaera borealis]MDR3621489.1 RluA family pseudouridine synthase [Paludisphaera borealis]
MSAGLDVVFEDEHCLAVVKPAGQFTQGTWAPPGETTLEQDVRRRLNPAAPESAYVGIVHRLDRPVSGVLIWAKNPKAARRLASQFEKRQAIKEYWAIVEVASGSDAPAPFPSASGSPIFPSTEAVWEDWLIPADQAGVVRSVREGDRGARRAVTRVVRDEAERSPENCAWLRLWPETGRTHQLRVQAAKRGMPILGDAIYGSRRPFTPGVALHARSLQVRHPTLSTPLVLVAPLPGSWGEQGIVIPRGAS